MAERSKQQKNKNREESHSLNMVDILGLCLSNWYWFVISLAICFLAAFVYLKKTSPIFVRSTSIVVKDDQSGKELENIFSKYRNTKSTTTTALNNEMIALRKPALMAKVVQRLKINFDYQVQGKLRNTTLYGSNLPIEVSVNGPGSGTYFSFKIRIHDSKNFTMLLNRKEKIKGRFDEQVKTPYGMIKVHRTNKRNPNPNDDLTVIHYSVADATSIFLSKLSVVNTNDESTVIDLSLADVDIERADDVLNTLIAVYNEQWIENRNQVIVSTNKFIKQRLIAIERELGDVENELTSYMVSNHTLDYTSEGTGYMGRSMAYEDQSITFENELSLTKYFRDFIAKVKDNAQTLPLSAGINNPALAEQVSQYNNLVMQRTNLAVATSEANPLVNDIDKKISVLHHGIMVTIDNHLNTLKAQVQMLHVNDQKNNAKIDATPSKQKQYVNIERRRKIKEQLYTFLLQTREQNELNQAFAAYNTRVLQPAGGSNYQSFPDERKVKLMALAIGLGIPLVLIILRELLNSKVRGRKDIEKLDIPFVGELPQIEFKDETKTSKFIEFMYKFASKEKKKRHKKEKSKVINHTVVKQGSRNVINEAFRVLRTNIEFIIGQNANTKIIMTTSANPGSGKTFISYNLALCMSLKGKKVCAIDLDLRRRQLSGYVEKPDKGVADYINGNCTEDWRDLLVKSDLSDTFWLLPVGTLPPNPAEILSYDSFNKLVAELRQEFDYIFFDCPPVEIVADTSILAKYADITLFVVRVGLMELDFLRTIEEYYTEHKFNNMGIILNGTLTASSRYGYRRYGYRYGYGYGYGYGGYGYYGDGYSDAYGDGYSHGYKSS